MNPFLLLTLSYLLGALPTSHWVAKGIHGVDLRTRGSGNLGATNTFRVLGWKAATPVVVFDVFKGWLPVWLFPRLLADPDLGWMLAFGAAAILGHVFSAWVGFRGGKGVATSAGVFLALAPWGLLVATVVFFGLAFATRIVSVGSVVSAAVLPFAVALTPHTGGNLVVGFSAVLAAFVIWAHRSNVGRLLRGEENRFGRTPAGGLSHEARDRAGGIDPAPGERSERDPTSGEPPRTPGEPPRTSGEPPRTLGGPPRTRGGGGAGTPRSGRPTRPVDRKVHS